MQREAELELDSTAKHVSDIEKDVGDRIKESRQILTSGGVESGKASDDLKAAKECAIKSITETQKFRKMTVTRKRTTITKTYTVRRQVVSQWNFELTQKKTSATAACSLAMRSKNPAEKARLADDCNKMKHETDQLNTQVSVENAKIDGEEKVAKESLAKEEQQIEKDKAKESIAVEEKFAADKNDVEETITSKK